MRDALPKLLEEIADAIPEVKTPILQSQGGGSVAQEQDTPNCRIFKERIGKNFRLTKDECSFYGKTPEGRENAARERNKALGLPFVEAGEKVVKPGTGVNTLPPEVKEAEFEDDELGIDGDEQG